MKKKSINHRKKRHLKKIVGSIQKPRLSIFKSNKHIYSQIINDISQETICSSSTTQKDFFRLDEKLQNKRSFTQNLNLSISYQVGQKLGKQANSCQISKIVFDRNFQLYHGNIKSLVEGIRAEGIFC